VLATPFADAAIGGEITATSDYIFRGISQSNGHAAAQIDLHASTPGGNFVGGWASTLDENDYELQLYVGHRFDLTPAWSATLTAVDYTYFRHSRASSDDYQELSASLSFLDRWSVSATVAPNAVRYWKGWRAGRHPAYVADATGQWPLVGRVFVTGGVGYYYLSGSSLPGSGGTGYSYGNAGLAYEQQSWRLDVGYFFTDERAQELFPYPRANNRLAATLSWHF
jgi:uncharacterized protein (TIGR02001 family)